MPDRRPRPAWVDDAIEQAEREIAQLPTPDRTVVDECVTYIAGSGTVARDSGNGVNDAEQAYRDWSYASPHPRALVSLSEDRQWLVTHDDDQAWDIWARKGDLGYVYHTYADDTGQDAADVLRDWQERQG